jgi:hypothetical protein
MAVTSGPDDVLFPNFTDYLDSPRTVALLAVIRKLAKGEDLGQMRDEDTLEGNDFQFHLGSLALLADKINVPDAGIPRTARVLHEYDHLVRLLGTSYGMVRHGLLSQYLHYFLQAFNQAGNLAKRPIGKTAVPQIENPKLFS